MMPTPPTIIFYLSIIIILFYLYGLFIKQESSEDGSIVFIGAGLYILVYLIAYAMINVMPI